MTRHSKPSTDTADSLYQRVAQVLDGIRPAVQEDGGDVEIVEVTADGQVRLRFKGACTACPSRDITLHQGIERNLRQRIPEITSVVAV